MPHNIEWFEPNKIALPDKQTKGRFTRTGCVLEILLIVIVIETRVWIKKNKL